MQQGPGEGFALVLPEVSTEAMRVFLDRFSATLSSDTHAVLVLDRAGWHGSRHLIVSDNVTLVPLPAYSPELNPVERIWLHLREHFFYVLSTGCHWNARPSDLPPRSTVWDYLDLWNWDGTIERIHHALYVQSREQAGKPRWRRWSARARALPNMASCAGAVWICLV